MQGQQLGSLVQPIGQQVLDMQGQQLDFLVGVILGQERVEVVAKRQSIYKVSKKN